MRYAEFYKEHGGRVMPAVGSDSVRVMDGRWGLGRMRAEAIVHGRSRGYVAFRLMSGDSILRSSPMGKLETID